MKLYLTDHFFLFQTVFLLSCSLALSHDETVFCDKAVEVEETKLLVEEVTNFFHHPWIFPGTKWCGPGNISSNYSDLGSKRDTDKCCRTHDSCKDTIEGLKTKHGLTNPLNNTASNCICDNNFYHCLKSSKEKTSQVVGNIYFTYYGHFNKCFKEEHPIICCKKYIPYHFWFKRCVDYKLNQKMPKKYQWFDVPIF